MKLELEQTIGLRAKLEYALDLVIEILKSVRDFSVVRDITFGETLFFFYVLGRAIWYLKHGVQTTFDYYFSDTTWMMVFVVLSLFHLFTFAINNRRARAVPILIYAIVWLFLAVLAWAANSQTAAFPSYSVLSLGSVYVAVRIWVDQKK